MKAINKKVKAVAIILTMLASVILSDNHSQAVEKAVAVRPPDNIQSIRKSNTSIRVQWKTVPNADGYIIYRCKPSSKKYVKVHTLACSKAGVRKQWTDKKLKKNKIYKYKIASYKNENGKQVVSSLSEWVSAKTYERGKKKINARAPKVSKKEVYLGLCSSKKLTCYVELAKYGKNKKKKAFSTKVRWRSSDTLVATVDKKGNITAKVKAGRCNVYAISHNGTRTKVKVTVKNYARAKSYTGTHLRENDIYMLVTDFKVPMQNIAEYYSIHRPKENETIRFSLNDEAEVVIIPQNADIGNLQKDIKTLLVDFPYYIDIEVRETAIEFRLKLEDSKSSLPAYVTFRYDNDCSAWKRIRIASHWEAYRFRPI